MATNLEKTAAALQELCNSSENCYQCQIRELCDEAHGNGNGCFAEDWLEWLQEECDD